VTLSSLLMFATGTKSVPPAGWSTQPTVDFLHEPEASGNRSQFPKATTCGCVLHLPVVHDTYDSFVDAMNFGISCAHGFGYA